MTDEEAIKAAGSSDAAEDFMRHNRQFILRCASKASHHYISESDDEWSIALVAFYEAVFSFNAEKGAFAPFAELVMRRRLTDYLRHISKFRAELEVDPAVFDGRVDEEGPDLTLQNSIVRLTVQAEDTRVRDEIDAVSAQLASYGISFYDLTSCSPKAAKTKASCARVIRMLISSPALLSDMRARRQLPLKTLQQDTSVPQKILERHRKYIIAAAEILDGDYPQLSEYLGDIKKEVDG